MCTIIDTSRELPPVCVPLPLFRMQKQDWFFFITRPFLRQNPLIDCSRRARSTISCVRDALGQRSRDGQCDRHRAIGTRSHEFCRKNVLPPPQIQVRHSRVRTAPVGWARRWTCTWALCDLRRASDLSAPVALRSRPEMSVAEARFLCWEWMAPSIIVCGSCVALSTRSMIQ